MKKAVCVVLLILLCACSGKRNVSPDVTGISFTAVVNYCDRQYECEVSVDNECAATVKVTKPSELTGLEFICRGEEITAQYMGLSYTPDLDAMPTGAVIKTLYAILRQADADNAIAEQDGGNYRFCGRVDNCIYTLYLSPSGLPLYVHIPDESYIIEFNNVTVK